MGRTRDISVTQEDFFVYKFRATNKRFGESISVKFPFKTIAA